jgi:hypothetical protein
MIIRLTLALFCLVHCVAARDELSALWQSPNISVEADLRKVHIKAEAILSGRRYADVVEEAGRNGLHSAARSSFTSEILLKEQCGPKFLGNLARLLLVMLRGEDGLIKEVYVTLRYSNLGDARRVFSDGVGKSKSELINQVLRLEHLRGRLREKPFIRELEVTFGRIYEPGEELLPKGYLFRWEIDGDAGSPGIATFEYRAASGLDAVKKRGTRASLPPTGKLLRGDLFPQNNKLRIDKAQSAFWLGYE